MTSASKHETRVDGSIVNVKRKFTDGVEQRRILRFQRTFVSNMFVFHRIKQRVSREGKELTFYLIRFNRETLKREILIYFSPYFLCQVLLITKKFGNFYRKLFISQRNLSISFVESKFVESQEAILKSVCKNSREQNCPLKLPNILFSYLKDFVSRVICVIC